MPKPREIRGTAGQRPVERFMQTYFEHSSALAKVARRFTARHGRAAAARCIADAVLSHRTEGILRIAPDELDAASRHLGRLCEDLESVLKLYRTARSTECCRRRGWWKRLKPASAR
ncbi:MAG: hypothetical protein U0992_23290 [Planctomycetaceae bacterium]